MKKLAFVLVSLLASEAAGAQTPKYPPLSEFMMPQEAEIALARSAAPDNGGDRRHHQCSGWKADRLAG